MSKHKRFTPKSALVYCSVAQLYTLTRVGAKQPRFAVLSKELEKPSRLNLSQYLKEVVTVVRTNTVEVPL